MQDVISFDAPTRRGRRLRLLATRARTFAPTRADAGLAAASVLLLVLSFPDFNFWPLAWVGLAPLMIAVVRAPLRGAAAFLLGWAAGTVFFYATCYWLSHAIIHYGGMPPLVAYMLLVPGALIVGLFPGLWAFALARLAARWGFAHALLLAPFAWAALEWARLGVTGQLWNALGYSQAFVPALIQSARWGGVYVVGFMMASVAAVVAFLLMKRDGRALAVSAAIVAAVALVTLVSSLTNESAPQQGASAVVVAVQPNVSVNFERSVEENRLLVERHTTLSADALGADAGTLPRVVVWPESPMNFRYARDAGFREFVGGFAREHRAAVIFNSLEPAPIEGSYNSAVMVNDEGRLVAQYDKIRLLPFGEYVPLPRWLPPVWLLNGIVGDFTPGAEYPLMPVGDARAGVFICFESAFPSIARRFADGGADVLINISNDGYLGRTPVIRQHLSNVVLRAVETGRPVVRVTNTGVSAFITPRGEVRDATQTFEPAVRAWAVGRATGGKTFYTRRGDLFAALCSAVTFFALLPTFKLGRRMRAR